MGRWARQAAAATLAGGSVLAVVGAAMIVAPPSAGAMTTLFAYPTGKATTSTTCPQTPVLTHECSLTRALQVANTSTGDTVDLAAQTGLTTATFTGNFTVQKTVTIKPATLPTTVQVGAILAGAGTGSVLHVAGTGHTTTVEDVTVTGGNASHGGGIDVTHSALVVTGLAIAGNQANTGAGIFGDASTVTVEGSVVNGNVGSGIVAFNSTLTVKDSTIEGNTGVGGGGGVDTSGSTTATIVQSTLVDNTAPTGAQLYNGGTTTLASDILATTSTTRPVAQCAGTAPVTDGYDIADDASCQLTGTGSRTATASIDHYLGTLANYGGRTATVPLLLNPSGAATDPEDPALGVVPSTATLPTAATACSVPDQRGDPRTAPCDVGAYEYQHTPVTLTQGAPTSGTVVHGVTSPLTFPLAVTQPTTTTGGVVFTVTSAVPTGVTVATTGTISVSGSTAAGGYTLDGTDGDAIGDSGTWSFALTVDKADVATSTSLQASASRATYGAETAVTLSGSVTGQAADGTPRGTATIATGPTAVCSGVSLTAGASGSGTATYRCTLAASQLAVGTHPGLHATYQPVSPTSSSTPSVAYAASASSPDATLSVVLATPTTPTTTRPTTTTPPTTPTTTTTRPTTPTTSRTPAAFSSGVRMAATPTGKGYWLTTGAGAVSPYGTAAAKGSMAGKPLNRPVVSLASDASGQGYWLVAADGGVFTFGNAAFHGSMAGQPLDAPVVGMAADPATGGYWLVAADGGVFAFTAPFYGSMGGRHLDAPIVGMTPMVTGQGYWLVAADGGVFAFGRAPFYGSMGGRPLARPVVAMAGDPATGGYWLVAADGGVFAFSAPFYGSYGSEGAAPPPVPALGLVVTPAGGGYWVVDEAGNAAKYP